MASPVVFISYRREDSAGHAGRLFDRLIDRIGRDHVFRDIDNIRAGDDFVETVRQRINACDVVLALIGLRWLTAADEEGRPRLADKNDLVRLEIATSLERTIRVIPVLLQGATMPGAKDLPAALAALSQRNAFEIRDTHFDRDVAQLIDILTPTWRHKLVRILHVKPVYSLIVAAGVVLLGLWLYAQIVLTPERARMEIASMGLRYDPTIFVQHAEANDAPVVDLFLRAGMNPDARDWNGNTALDLAAREGNLALAKTLVKSGADVNRPLWLAAHKGRTEVVDFLLSRKPNHEAIEEALIGAAPSGDAALVQKFIAIGANVNYRNQGGHTALMDAAYYGGVDVVQLLLAHGADVHAVNSDGETALHYATRSNRPSVEVVRALLQNGAEVNARSYNGTTPLLNALGNRDVMLLLLAHKADARAYTNNHETALMYAAAQNLPALVKPLVERGADINAQNDRGQTALMSATGAIDAVDKPEMVDALLDNGANMNLVDKHGWTALMFAADAGNVRAAHALISRGADPNVRNEEGDTALIIATKRGRKEIVQLLKERKAVLRRK